MHGPCSARAHREDDVAKRVAQNTSVASWSASWGRALAAFTPAMLVAAIDREARAVAEIAGGDGGVQRASTRTTALSQYCPCGAPVGKRLSDRVHRCPACKLVGDRDDVAAVLASFVVLTRRVDPSSARVDFDAASDSLEAIRRVLDSSSYSYQGWQDTLSESTDLSARDGSFVAWSMSTPDPVAVARRNVGMAACSTRNEIGARQTKSDRARVRTDTSRTYVLRWTTYGTILRSRTAFSSSSR